MLYVIKVFKRGFVNEEFEIRNNAAAWDCYQFYRMAFPAMQVTMIDCRTNEIVAKGKN